MSDNVSKELKPCPFCGTTPEHVVSNGCENMFVECHQCGTSGPVEADENSAITAWNTRIEQASTGEAVAWLHIESNERDPENQAYCVIGNAADKMADGVYQLYTHPPTSDAVALHRGIARPDCELRPMYAMLNPPKLLGYDILAFPDKQFIGVVRPENMPHPADAMRDKQDAEIAKLAIAFREAAQITEGRVNSEEFWAAADPSEVDEIDLEEVLARQSLFYAIDAAMKPLQGK